MLNSKNIAYLTCAIALSVVALLFAGALMFTSGFMISLAATIPLTVLALHVPSLFVRIFGIGKPIIAYVQRLTSHDWVLRATSKLRLKVYQAVERTNICSLSDNLTKFTDGIDHVQNLYLRSVIPLASLVSAYAIVSIATALLSPLLALSLLVVFVLISIAIPLWTYVICNPKISKLYSIQKQINNISIDSAMFCFDWKLTGRRDDFISRLNDVFKMRYELEAKINSTLRILSFLRDALCVACVCIVFFWGASAFGSIANGLNPSLFVATDLLTDLANLQMHDSNTWALNWLAAFVICAFPILEASIVANEAAIAYAKNKPASSDLNDLLNSSENKTANIISKEINFGDNINFACGSIILDGVSFAYANSADKLIADANLHIKRGKHIAIVGRSGAGKTTLLNLIAGQLSPSAGTVHAAGKVCFIEQNPYIFSTTLAQNLYLANPHATNEMLLDALDAVGLRRLTSRSEHGLNVMLAEDGQNISGGERTRLSLARALLFDADIILLDEPFQGLDSDTAKLISDTIHTAFAGKTLVVVTHELDYLDNFDEIYDVAKLFSAH